ncbi:MAG: CCA tRNA nucleotidyltransferase [Pseudomonadota bacterium]
MKLDAGWLHHPSTRKAVAALQDQGHSAWFVGGCVRNALLAEPVGDIDLATTARPEQTIAAAKLADLKSIPTGIDHGTVTVVADGMPFEITTLRRDVATDGRRATVAFADRIEEDAARRDFTMNALYADPEGCVLDPVGGLPDIMARRVRFIGDADARLSEDRLRALRFFRFHAWYGSGEDGPDPDALAAIADHLDGLSILSKERVRAELLKLLSAPNPAPAVASMEKIGVLARLVPGASGAALGVLVHLESEIEAPPNPIRRLAAICDTRNPVDLRLSRKEARLLSDIRHAAEGTAGAGELAYRMGKDVAMDALLVRAALTGSALPNGWRGSLEEGETAAFPIKAADLQSTYEGPALGERLRMLEDRWIASGFKLSRESLLA